MPTLKIKTPFAVKSSNRLQSQQVIAWLVSLGYKNPYNLTGGDYEKAAYGINNHSVIDLGSLDYWDKKGADIYSYEFFKEMIKSSLPTSSCSCGKNVNCECTTTEVPKDKKEEKNKYWGYTSKSENKNIKDLLNKYPNLGIMIPSTTVKKDIEYIPYQLCPKCQGSKSESQCIPQYGGYTYTRGFCSLCKGTGIIPMHKIN